MKTAIRCSLGFILVLFAVQPVAAQVYDVNQFKVTVYAQTNAAPPTQPNFPDAWYFGTYIDTDPDYSVNNVFVFTPGTNGFFLNQESATYFEFGSPFYDNETNLDGDYPGGTYDYNYDYTDLFGNTNNTDIFFDLDTNDLYAAVIPAFTPACWTAMQAVDPAQDFTLNWNSYAVSPGADYAETFLSISDQMTGNALINPSGPPGITSTNIPAGTLQYGKSYNVSLYFSERQNPVDFGSGDAFITVGWDNLTQTTLTTVPLWLQIAPAGTNVILTWPADATNYLLETTTNLANPSPWDVVTNLPVVSGATNLLTVPATNPCAFFRLAEPGD